MARRLALLAILASAVALHRPPQSSPDYSDSDSADPLVLWDDYDDSRDSTQPPLLRLYSTTFAPKVLLKNKGPKVNVTVKNKSDDKKIIKTTNISIESHTNFIVTKAPATRRPAASVDVGQHYVLVHSSEQVAVQTTRKPGTTRRPPTTAQPTTRRPVTRRPTARPTRPLPKTTKGPRTKKTTCASKTTEWLSSFFQSEKEKKTPKTPPKSGWFLGRFTMIFISSS